MPLATSTQSTALAAATLLPLQSRRDLRAAGLPLHGLQVMVLGKAFSIMAGSCLHVSGATLSTIAATAVSSTPEHHQPLR